MLKLAYFSPLTPQRSGIADYSEELLPFLAARSDIELFVDGFQPANEDLVSRFRILDYAREPSVLEQLANYDAALFHIGNDHRYHAGIHKVARQHPGIVVLHDFSLQHFFCGLAETEVDGVEAYLNELEASSGYAERRIAKSFFDRATTPPHALEPLRYPLNDQLANRSEGLIVHSEWGRRRLQKIAPATPIRRVPHFVSPDARSVQVEKSNSDLIRIASFGFINPEKGLERALRVLANLRDRFDFRYRLVGELNPHFDIRSIVRDLGLQERVEVTGFVSLEKFVSHIAETDIAINLREQTVGETSGSLCRILNAGVTAIVSDDGWFSELPDDCVVKIDMQHCTDELLEAYLDRLMADPSLRCRIGDRAKQYVADNHSIEDCAKGYLEFVEEIVSRRPRRRLIQSVAAEVASLGLAESVTATFLPELAREVAAIVTTEEKKNGGDTGKPQIPSPGAATTTPERDELTVDRGRLPKLEGIDYAAGAKEYAGRITEERRHHLFTKPFYNLANKPAKYEGAGIDADSHRHFCDFANMAATLALPPGSRVLDVGCGSGWLSEYFARFGYRVTGIDISEDLIEISRDRLSQIAYGVDHRTPLEWRFETLNIERAALDEEFDAVICYDSLHHFVDEKSTLKHIAQMTKPGGMLFILEGEKPPENSASADELRGVMQEFATLESPFDPSYLRNLLDEYGFAIVGDYVSVNGLFARESIEQNDRLPIQIEPLNYLLCKKVSVESPASSVANSRKPNILAARLSLSPDENLLAAGFNLASENFVAASGEVFHIPLEIENSGDTLWLTSRDARRGSVMAGIKIFDAGSNLVSESHTPLPLPGGAFAPHEKTRVILKHSAPQTPAKYTLKIDLVCEEICWFAENGRTKPLTISFEVN